MPELPDVEIFKQYLDATALHQEIAHTRVRDERILEGVSAATLQRRASGRRFARTARRGKHLFAALDDNGWLALHFGMTGYLRYFRRENHSPAHVRLSFHFTNDYLLVYICRRRLGRVTLTDSPEAYARDRKLGPDALTEIDASSLRQRLAGRRGSLKSALMNQQVIAGIGNIYADEILFQAQLHPETPLPDLHERDIDGVYDALGKVLTEALEARADPERMPRGFLLPRRREDAPCPRCGTSIRKITVSGRSTYFCPRCQKTS
jgi:formamidopyrimidine-DNA glycosylase